MLFWPPVLATWGAGGVSEAHRHHAAQVIVALSGSMVLRGGCDSAVEAVGVYAPSGAPHAVDAEGCDVLVLFAEPRSDLGQALVHRFPGRDARAVQDEASAVRALLPSNAQSAEHVAAIRGAMPSLLHALGAPLVPPSAVHPGIRRVLRHLESAPSSSNTTLEHLATIAGLSPGRFTHAFTQSVGSPLRHYLLWQKLGRAAAALAAGSAASAAANHAGFADAAHCTRTFRRMFGVTPSHATRGRPAG